MQFFLCYVRAAEALNVSAAELIVSEVARKKRGGGHVNKHVLSRSLDNTCLFTRLSTQCKKNPQLFKIYRPYRNS